MNKSELACRWSLEKLLDGKKWAYLWTFTLPTRIPVDVACSMWRDLNRDLVRRVGMKGIRVFELHPNGHGLHVHLITSERFSVHPVRHCCHVHGWGRIDVKAIPAADADYVAKYLTKTRRNPVLKGKRLWQAFGGIKAVRVSDIEIDSPLSREIKKVPYGAAYHQADISTGYCQTEQEFKAQRDHNRRAVQWSRFLIAFRRVYGNAKVRFLAGRRDVPRSWEFALMSNKQSDEEIEFTDSCARSLCAA